MRSLGVLNAPFRPLFLSLLLLVSAIFANTTPVSVVLPQKTYAFFAYRGSSMAVDPNTGNVYIMYQDSANGVQVALLDHNLFLRNIVNVPLASNYQNFFVGDMLFNASPNPGMLFMRMYVATQDVIWRYTYFMEGTLDPTQPPICADYSPQPGPVLVSNARMVAVNPLTGQYFATQKATSVDSYTNPSVCQSPTTFDPSMFVGNLDVLVDYTRNYLYSFYFSGDMYVIDASNLKGIGVVSLFPSKLLDYLEYDNLNQRLYVGVSDGDISNPNFYIFSLTDPLSPVLIYSERLFPSAPVNEQGIKQISVDPQIRRAYILVPEQDAVLIYDDTLRVQDLVIVGGTLVQASPFDHCVFIYTDFNSTINTVSKFC